MAANRFELQAALVQRETLRYSPAGIPILNAMLSHASEQIEAGTARKVELELAAVFAGKAAEAASRLELGSTLRLAGFLAPRRKGSRQVSLHVTEFELIEV